MRIRAMATDPITMTLSTPIPMSNGVIEKTGNVLVKLVSDEGVVGWGEGLEAPALTHQTQEDIVADLDALPSIVIGSDLMRRHDLWGRPNAARPPTTPA